MATSPDDRVRVARIVGQIGDEADRRWLQDRLAEPWQRRARRLEERDARIRDYALALHPLLSGRAMALAIAVELQRYRASGFRFEAALAAPGDPRRGLLWRILHLNNGRNLSPGSVRNALAGVIVVAGRKSTRRQASGAATPSRLGLKSGTRRNARGGEKANAGKRR